MITNLFVNGLPYSVTSDELREHFATAGEVKTANVITDRVSGQSRGFGFVEMATPEDAQKAIDMFNNQDMGGRTVIVTEARPREAGSRPPRGN